MVCVCVWVIGASNARGLVRTNDFSCSGHANEVFKTIINFKMHFFSSFFFVSIIQLTSSRIHSFIWFIWFGIVATNLSHPYSRYFFLRFDFVGRVFLFSSDVASFHCSFVRSCFFVDSMNLLDMNMNSSGGESQAAHDTIKNWECLSWIYELWFCVSLSMSLPRAPLRGRNPNTCNAPSICVFWRVSVCAPRMID